MYISPKRCTHFRLPSLSVTLLVATNDFPILTGPVQAKAPQDSATTGLQAELSEAREVPLLAGSLLCRSETTRLQTLKTAQQQLQAPSILDAV